MNRDSCIKLSELIDGLLKTYGHTRDEITCVLWAPDEISMAMGHVSSIDLATFWRYAEKEEWDNNEWSSGPHYPMYLLSGKGWWLESIEYDSRTDLVFNEEPKAKPVNVGITESGALY